MGWLADRDAAALEHEEVEGQLRRAGGRWCGACWGFISRRGRSVRSVWTGSRMRRESSIARLSDHERPLASVFGEVTVGRLAYRAKGEANLYVADGC